MRATPAAFLLSLALLLSACGGNSHIAPGAANTAGPDDAVSSSPSPDECRHEECEPEAQYVRPRDGLVDVAPRRFEKVEGEGRELTILFYSGVEKCYGLDRVEVEESDDRVTITLYEGRDPEADVCIELAVWKATVVELERPLGDRKVVDGARKKAD